MGGRGSDSRQHVGQRTIFEIHERDPAAGFQLTFDLRLKFVVVLPCAIDDVHRPCFRKQTERQIDRPADEEPALQAGDIVF
jgi:hypothetical protein